MSIFDYNPTNITPYPYWRWNKVLPAVYDDSLSQYEILSKLLHTVNDIIESTNTTGEQVERLTQLVQQLIDGEFPSGIVQYVRDIVDAVIDDDIAAVNTRIAALEAQVNSYNQSLQGQIDTLNTNLTALENEIAISSIRKECTLMLGDSYAQGEHAESATSHGGPNWQQILVDIFGFTDVYMYKAGSGGFVATSTSTSGSASSVPVGTTYNDVLNYAYNYINGLGRANEVKNIIIQGGVNDGSWLQNGTTTEASITTAIGTCLSNLHLHFPNAKIYVVYVACGYTSWQKTAARKISIPVLFEKAATNWGAVYGQCTNLPWCYGNDVASHDGSHPTSDMQRLIAGYIAKLMLGDDKDYDSTFAVPAGTYNSQFIAQVTSDHRLIFPVGNQILFPQSGGVPFNNGTVVQPVLVEPNSRLEFSTSNLLMPFCYFNGNASYIGQFDYSATGRIKWIQRDQGATATTRDYITSLNALIDVRIG